MSFFNKRKKVKALEWRLGNDISANYVTIDVMKKVARARYKHPKVRQWAGRILSLYSIGSQNYVDEALAIGHFVKKNVRYVRDAEGMEQLTDPLMMLDQIEDGISQGDCDDMALLIATLLLSIGHQPYFRAVRYEAAHPTFQHIYVVVYESNFRGEDQRIALDAILKDKPIGFELPHESGKEFPV